MVYSSDEDSGNNEDLGNIEEPKKKGERTLVSIVGSTARIEGKFDVSKSIEIDCEVSGELKVGGIMVIQKKGFVSADVNTVDAKIIGRYNGSMKAAGNVEITETGIVDGKIKTDTLIINKGAIFSGNVTRITKDKEEKKAKIKEKKSKSKTKKKMSIKNKAGEEGKKKEAKIENIGIGGTNDLKF